jgi:hypothetical protein
MRIGRDDLSARPVKLRSDSTIRQAPLQRILATFSAAIPHNARRRSLEKKA